MTYEFWGLSEFFVDVLVGLWFCGMLFFIFSNREAIHRNFTGDWEE